MFSVSSANWFAYLALVGFVPLAVVVYRYAPPTRATLFMVLVGVMFLPSRLAIDLPLFPRLGKESITYIAVALGMCVHHWGRIARSRPGRGVEILLIVMLVASAMTTLTNTDTLRHGPKVIQGMAPFEMFTACLAEFLKYALPFYFGRLLFRRTDDLRDLFVAMMIAGLVYSLFLAVELRLSPQMHRWTYGFHPNNFGSVKRWGGFRPMVYMDSGLAVGVFMVNVVMASWTSVRVQLKVFSVSAKLVAPYLFVFLMMSKSVASMVWGAVFTPLLLFLRPRQLALVAVLLAALVAAYPLLRITNVFPWQGIVSVAESIDPERARSLNYRFENDENMLAKARQRFIFGWGGYSRNWAYDDATGNHLTVPDGAWIIRLSSNGIVGFYCLYLLYVIPVVLAFRRIGRIRDKRTQLMLAGLMLMVAIRAVDQLPNGLYSSYPIFFAGALYNLSRSLPLEEARARKSKRARRRIPADPGVAAQPTPMTEQPSGSTAELLGVRSDDSRPRRTEHR